MSDFEKILKAIEEGGRYKLSKNCDPNTYEYWEWSDSKSIIIYLGDYNYGTSVDLDFDAEGNLIEIC